MVVSEALAIVHVLQAIGRCCGDVYSVAMDHSADIHELAKLGIDISAGHDLFMLNKKHALELIQIADMIEADLRGFKEKEKRGQVSSAMLGHLKDVVRSLKKARSTVKSVIMPADVAKSTMRKVAWIVDCFMNRSSLQQSLVDTTAALVRSCQLLHFAVQLRAECMRQDPDDGGADDAAEIRKLMGQDRLEMSVEMNAQLQPILVALQQSCVQQDHRIIAEVQRMCNQQLELHAVVVEEVRSVTREMKHCAAQPPSAAAVSVLASSHLPLPRVREGPELVIDSNKPLGAGSGGLVCRALYKPPGKAEVEAAFKEVRAPHKSTAKDKQRMERQLRKEADIQWAINGDRNCLRLLAVCTEPPGLVLELCNAGQLDQWLWAEAKSTVKGQVVRTLLPNHLLPRGNASEQQAIAPTRTHHHQHAKDDHPDAEGEDEDDTYASLLADGRVMGCFTLLQRIAACSDVIHAVDYLHGRHLSHRDIKADNVLVQRMSDSVLTFKLGDFGSAKVERSCTGLATSTARAESATGGTERWQSKEALVAVQRQKPKSSSAASPPAAHLAVDDRRSDMYSLVLLIASILTSLPPYADLGGEERLALSHAINTGRLPYEEQQLRAVSPALLRLVQLSMAVATRPSMLTLKYEHWPAIMSDVLAAPSSSSSSSSVSSVAPSEGLASSFSQLSLSVVSPSSASTRSTRLSSPPASSPASASEPNSTATSTSGEGQSGSGDSGDFEFQFWATALSDFHMASNSRVTYVDMRAGDTIAVLQAGEQWWYGEVRGRQGFFLASHAKRLRSNEQPSTPSSTASPPYRPPYDSAGSFSSSSSSSSTSTPSATRSARHVATISTAAPTVNCLHCGQDMVYPAGFELIRCPACSRTSSLQVMRLGASVRQQLATTGVQCYMERVSANGVYYGQCVAGRHTGRVMLRCTPTELTWEFVDRAAAPAFSKLESGYELTRCLIKQDTAEQQQLQSSSHQAAVAVAVRPSLWLDVHKRKGSTREIMFEFANNSAHSLACIHAIKDMIATAQQQGQHVS